MTAKSRFGPKPEAEDPLSIKRSSRPDYDHNARHHSSGSAAGGGTIGGGQAVGRHRRHRQRILASLPSDRALDLPEVPVFLSLPGLTSLLAPPIFFPLPLLFFKGW